MPGSPFDAILIPGGGVREGGALPSWVRSRLDLACEIHQGERIIALSAGTPHRPPPLDEGFPIFESTAAARYLISKGVPAARILVEASSYDTIGNAYFARAIHTDPAGLRNLAVVTSRFHMARARRAFEWIFGLPPLEVPYRLTFFETVDEGLDRNALTARVEKEQAALAALDPVIASIQDLRSLHDWLFQRHSAYATGGTRRTLNAALRESY